MINEVQEEVYTFYSQKEELKNISAPCHSGGNQ